MYTVTLTASADTFLNNAAPDDNYGAYGETSVGEYNGGTQVTRTLIKWDFSSIANATILSATMKLYAAADYTDNQRTISAYRVKRAWVEGSNNGAPGSGACWNKYDATNSWGTAGCGNTTSDREAVASGSGIQPATVSANQEISLTMTVADIQAMINGGYINNGFLLKVDTESNDQVTYRPRQFVTAAYRPQLILEVSNSMVSSFML